MKLTRDEYLEKREFYRSRGFEALEKNDLTNADYFSGIVRGLDLAFGEGSADPELAFRKAR